MRRFFGKVCAGALAAALCMGALPATAFAYTDAPEESIGAEITAADVVAAAVDGYNAYTEATSGNTVESESASTAGAASETTASGIGGTNALTPDGTGTVVDTATDEDGKLFYTITTEAGNVFYLVIDEQRTGENVYFLNAVTESDLLALAASAETGGTSGIGTMEPTTPAETEPVEINPTPEDEPGEAEQPADSGGVSAGTLFFILVLAAAAGGAGWYFKVYKPKQQMLEDAEDMEDFVLEGDPEEQDDMLDWGEDSEIGDEELE